jgi:hypothetical protein
MGQRMPDLKAIALQIAATLPDDRQEAQKVLGLVADLMDWRYDPLPEVDLRAAARRMVRPETSPK